MKDFMMLAIKEAEKAALMGEIPVGAVLVFENKVIAAAHNLKETQKDPSAHAEMLVIRQAAKILNDWRLPLCDLYVTLEPCRMCAGVIAEARLRRVYFGAYDIEKGASDTLIPSCEVYGGICEDECKKILTDFFNTKR